MPTPPAADHAGALHAQPRGLRYRWKLPGAHAGEAARGDLLARVLASRPWLDKADPRPALTQLHDPESIPDIDRAATLLLESADAARPIAIYGDFDVDGATAAAILHHALRALRPDAPLLHAVPHRLRDGYGLHDHLLDELADRGARTVVTVDCGITARAQARHARALGLALIITDHHNPPACVADMPQADAVVHPGRPDSAYPFAHLCGAGVAFKLAWRMAALDGGGRATAPMRTTLLDLLPLAALGTVADVMPLIGENRALVATGLAMGRRTRVRGLAAMAEHCVREPRPLVAADLAFRLGPRINALGRVDDASAAFELLTTSDGGRIAAILATMDRLNADRQAIERRIVDQASQAAADAAMDREPNRAIVLAHPDWHPGVVGIACARLVERFGRPTILLQHQGERCRGSARSISGFNIHGALSRCAGHLRSFGGHDAAAGLSLDTGRLDAFTADFLALAAADIPPERLTPELAIDAAADLHEMHPDAVRRLERLAPFGRGNPAPRILVRGVRVPNPPAPMGAGGRHLSVLVQQGEGVTRLVGFDWADDAESLRAGSRLDVVVTPELDSYRGHVGVRCRLVDAGPGDY